VPVRPVHDSDAGQEQRRVPAAERKHMNPFDEWAAGKDSEWWQQCSDGPAGGVREAYEAGQAQVRDEILALTTSWHSRYGALCLPWTRMIGDVLGHTE
jgi:hypothetical protein